jgi:pyrimidine-specific ribonucleoside hydrolase
VSADPRVGWPTFYAAKLSPRRAPVGTAAKPLPIILDTDPGLDDALAIAVAVARPELKLLGVTSVGGNADVHHCTANARRLLHLYGADDVPVAEGAAGPLSGPLERATEIHGESGLGATKLAEATRPLEPGGAVALMVRLIESSPEPVALVPVGPLTNIAMLLRGFPHLAPKIAEICLMGGSVGEGNATASAEFNIYADPVAAEIVFASGLPITMIGLDVTHHATLGADDLATLAALPGASAKVASELLAFAFARAKEWGQHEWMAIHDAVAVLHLAIPDLVGVARYRVVVDGTNGPARGRTIGDASDYRLKRDRLEANCDVGLTIDRARFVQLLVDAYRTLP